MASHAVIRPRSESRGRSVSIAQARSELFARLQARRGEIELAIQNRVDAISDPGAVNPSYADGLRTAVSSALDYGLTGIERGVERIPPVPSELLAQARFAAQSGVNLDTVLRRYFAGYTLLGDFLVQEIEDSDRLQVSALRSLLRSPAVIFDHLVTAVTEEYTRASEELLSSAKARQAEQVRRLLAGQLLDTSELAYDFDGWHLGVLVEGGGAVEAIRDLATTVDRRLLLVQDSDGPIWAWLGGRNRLDLTDASAPIAAGWPPQLAITLGEPGYGISGWRLTHRQAMAAWPIAQRCAEHVVRYSDVALSASMFQDEVLIASLRQLYLDPLATERDGGRALRETLRAYFAAERNVSSAAAMLGVSRRTVANRLRTAETKIGRPLAAVLTEIDAALRLEDLGV